MSIFLPLIIIPVVLTIGYINNKDKHSNPILAVEEVKGDAKEVLEEEDLDDGYSAKDDIYSSKDAKDVIVMFPYTDPLMDRQYFPPLLPPPIIRPPCVTEVDPKGWND